MMSRIMTPPARFIIPDLPHAPGAELAQLRPHPFGRSESQTARE
jgi:hypothetical protein